MLPLLSLAKAQVPHSEAFKGWKFDPSFEADGSDLKTLNKVSLACESSMLYPTHPQQDTKTYHLAVYGEYNNQLVLGGDKGPFADICQAWTRGAVVEKRMCLKSKTINMVVLSDLYQDACGNVYRGFFKKQFFTTDETMGTLVSPGKTFYENPYSEFIGTKLVDTYVGGTNPVPASQFLYFTRASALDMTRIQKNIELAKAKGQYRNPQTGLFNEGQPTKPHGK